MPFNHFSPPPYCPPEDQPEEIPPYSNSILLAALLPRKVEYSGGTRQGSPWRKEWCVLEGTCLKIYRNIRPLSRSLSGRLFRQDATSPTYIGPPLPDITSHLIFPTFTAESRHEEKPSGPHFELVRSETSHSRDSDISSATSEMTLASLAYATKPSALVRQYTLQNAKCGLATGYDKRTHVIRIRVHGEQFLLQLETLHQVVQWLDTIQAAVDIALDIDERPMTQGPSYPRHPRDH